MAVLDIQSALVRHVTTCLGANPSPDIRSLSHLQVILTGPVNPPHPKHKSATRNSSSRALIGRTALKQVWVLSRNFYLCFNDISLITTVSSSRFSSAELSLQLQFPSLLALFYEGIVPQSF